MKNKKLSLIGVLVLVAVLIVGFVFFNQKNPYQEVSEFDIRDITSDFYLPWLAAVKDPNSSPNLETLAQTSILSKTLRERLVEWQKDPSSGIDPVLCQTVVPENISSRKVYEDSTGAEMLIMSRDKTVAEQAIVKFTKQNNGWYIEDIRCSPGEFAPEREFTFERPGLLLKQSVPSPYDSKIWHLIFDENGANNDIVPLMFDENSQCKNLDGDMSVCKNDEFTESTKVFIKGEMTERGVNVKQLEFVK